MKKTKTNNWRIFMVLALFAMCCQTNLKAQGWTWYYIQNAGGPFQEEGAYVTSIADFVGDTSFFAINFPAFSGAYTFFHITDRPKYTSTPWFSQIDDNLHLSRDIVRISTDTVAVLEELLPENGGDFMVNLVLYDLSDTNAQGNYSPGYIWNEKLFDQTGFDGFAVSLEMNDNGEYFVLAEREESISSPGTRDMMAFKLSHEGDLIWSSVFGHPGYEKAVAAVPSNAMPDALLALKTIAPTSNTSLRQSILYLIDEDGLSVSETNLSPFGSEEALDMISLSDGNLLMSGADLSNNETMFFRKLDEDGNEIWRKDYPLTGRSATAFCLVEDPTGDLVAAGTITDSSTMKTDALLLKMDANGFPLWERNIDRDFNSETFKSIALHPDGGYLLGGSLIKIENNNDSVTYSFMAKTDVNGVIKAGLIKGNVLQDLDLDCANSAGDAPLEDWVVQAYLDSLHIFYGDTDSLGNYRIECDTGEYIVSLMRPVDYWGVCTNHVPVSVSYLDTIQVDFAVQTVIECPFLTVDHFTTAVRPCDTTTVYVNYCNKGTVTAEGAYLEMTLDSLLTYLDGEIPPSATNDNLITFPLGDIGAGECPAFKFRVFVDCNAVQGQTVCTEAHIFPDSICLAPDPQWSGAYITADGGCDGDTVYFQLHNIGNEPMAQPLEYIVIEDAVLLMQNTFELSGIETIQVPVLATGATYHLIAQQEPGAPGNSTPIAAVEGCVGSSGNLPSTGFFTQFPQNDGNAFISSYCSWVTNSFDPNDKQALPTGFGTPHNIFRNTDLEYLIRFQNTGTDTAFRVVLVDTLSQFLDPSTVRPGASSHPYEFEIEENGALRFTFPNIQLPHEAVDEEGSQGFVNFRISQKSNNPIGTVIENSAEIYFDFNLPVITNTTWHTVHEPWIEIINDPSNVDGGFDDFGELLVYPNPSVGQVNFELPENIDPNRATFSLYDQSGRLVQAERFTGSRLQFERSGHTTGVYFYRVEVDGLGIYTGKMILH